MGIYHPSGAVPTPERKPVVPLWHTVVQWSEICLFKPCYPFFLLLFYFIIIFLQCGFLLFFLNEQTNKQKTKRSHCSLYVTWRYFAFCCGYCLIGVRLYICFSIENILSSQRGRACHDLVMCLLSLDDQSLAKCLSN